MLTEKQTVETPPTVPKRIMLQDLYAEVFGTSSGRSRTEELSWYEKTASMMDSVCCCSYTEGQISTEMAEGEIRNDGHIISRWLEEHGYDDAVGPRPFFSEQDEQAQEWNISDDSSNQYSEEEEGESWRKNGGDLALGAGPAPASGDGIREKTVTMMALHAPPPVTLLTPSSNTTTPRQRRKSPSGPTTPTLTYESSTRRSNRGGVVADDDIVSIRTRDTSSTLHTRESSASGQRPTRQHPTHPSHVPRSPPRPSRTSAMSNSGAPRIYQFTSPLPPSPLPPPADDAGSVRTKDSAASSSYGTWPLGGDGTTRRPRPSAPQKHQPQQRRRRHRRRKSTNNQDSVSLPTTDDGTVRTADSTISGRSLGSHGCHQVEYNSRMTTSSADIAYSPAQIQSQHPLYSSPDQHRRQNGNTQHVFASDDASVHTCDSMSTRESMDSQMARIHHYPSSHRRNQQNDHGTLGSNHSIHTKLSNSLPDLPYLGQTEGYKYEC